jgi:hypothetical protein
MDGFFFGSGFRVATGITKATRNLIEIKSIALYKYLLLKNFYSEILILKKLTIPITQTVTGSTLNRDLIHPKVIKLSFR